MRGKLECISTPHEEILSSVFGRRRRWLLSTSWHWCDRATTNLRVHRTEPFSVQQFGDRSTARGVSSSPSNSIEQWSWDSQFFPGEVGIANISSTYGTEGAHAFVSTAANLLFGNTFTHVADVESGYEVAASLEVGDRILSATIL